MEPGTVSPSESPDELYERLLPENATVLDRAVLTVLVDPWTYISYLILFMLPLIAISVYATWILLRDSAKERLQKKAKRKAKKARARKSKAQQTSAREKND